MIPTSTTTDQTVALRPTKEEMAQQTAAFFQKGLEGPRTPRSPMSRISIMRLRG
ncbi:hypothetical protein [Spirosoma telluris]|uniref:hypothetical protein n=1 Tax=Spirosoma telluris TaxID=2183553 RepID=UPI002FC32A2C